MSNIQKLATLKPKVAQMAQSLIDECKTQLGANLLIIQAYRSKEEQDALYAQGRTTQGKIVTNAKGGSSFHNFGVAFDCVPIDEQGNAEWYYDFSKIAKIAEKIGLEWGDRGYVDMDHFEYRAGYPLEDFQNGKIDWSKFELSSSKNSYMIKWVKFFSSEPKEVVTYFVADKFLQNDGMTHEFVSADDAQTKSTSDVFVFWNGVPVGVGHLVA